ncbi:hypothetical protein DXT99_01115 [Pontibacter diazotrophicus]|uniref:Uncharacterized protein n=1 Tax=Pontibacter diazotrophicus TaxID=1400979 RepID=A0A3D8LIR6_9BACT|nr:hypothetical protein DXT99_01115 [Pontibacter diazotrophicus]
MIIVFQTILPFAEKVMRSDGIEERSTLPKRISNTLPGLFLVLILLFRTESSGLATILRLQPV